MSKISLFIITSTLILLQGCVVKMPTPDDPYYEPVMPEVKKNQQYSLGGLYDENQYISLFEDNKAKRVGDIVTIVLAENTEASVEFETEFTKETDISLQNPTVLGSPVQFNAPGILPLQSNTNNNLAVTVGGDNEFSGESDSAQKNEVTGTIAVTVIQVLPNGNLVVRGEKWLNLNQGKEYIRISGIIRPEDITSDNSIISTKLANARISYGGTGTLADANAPGWLSRIVTSFIWPF